MESKEKEKTQNDVEKLGIKKILTSSPPEEVATKGSIEGGRKLNPLELYRQSQRKLFLCFS